jgi:thioredoxin-related protein
LAQGKVPYSNHLKFNQKNGPEFSNSLYIPQRLNFSSLTCIPGQDASIYSLYLLHQKLFMKKIYFALFLSLLSLTTLNAQVRSASEILTEAQVQATQENKKVLVLFHASWCSWCRKMDKSLADPAIKSLIDKSYVIAHLTVLESPEKKALENPGALEIYQSRAGTNELGLPFWMVYDKDGKILADAQMKAGESVGCPATEAEVAYFISVLRRTSKLTPAELQTVAQVFRKNDQ